MRLRNLTILTAMAAVVLTGTGHAAPGSTTAPVGVTSCQFNTEKFEWKASVASFVAQETVTCYDDAGAEMAVPQIAMNFGVFLLPGNVQGSPPGISPAPTFSSWDAQDPNVPNGDAQFECKAIPCTSLTASNYDLASHTGRKQATLTPGVYMMITKAHIYLDGVGLASYDGTRTSCYLVTTPGQQPIGITDCE